MKKRQCLKNILSFMLAFAMVLGTVPLPEAVLQAHAEGGAAPALSANEDVVTISTSDEWKAFATSVNNGTTYAGKTVMLLNDISISGSGNASNPDYMTGTSESRSFQGIFNGCGKTLTLDIKYSKETAAPFRYIKNATIKNLKLAGTIVPEKRYAATIASHTYGTCSIHNCISSAKIDSLYSGNAVFGGFVSVVEGGKLTVRDCLYNGKLTPWLSQDVKQCGGFVGQVNSGAELVMENCLFDPEKIQINTSTESGSMTFARTEEGAVCTFTNCYYTKTLAGIQEGTFEVGASSGTDTADKLAVALGDQWEVVGSGSSAKAVPIVVSLKLSDAAVSGIASLYDYTGEEIPLSYTVFSAIGIVLEEGTDYTASFKCDGEDAGSVQEVGSYELTVTAVDGNSGGYTGSKTVTFSVVPIPKVISSVDDWNDFTYALINLTDYSGKTVTLTEDITVTTMAGDADHRFSGIFDGCGHTLTLDYNAAEESCAPFRYIDGATIKCLKTAGTITTSHKFAAGLVSHSYGNSNIRNCISSVTIDSSVTGDGTHGGFVGVVEDGTLSVTDCLFNGKLLGSSTKYCGGFTGWVSSKSVMSNCLFEPEEITINGTGCYTFARCDAGRASFSKCYYTWKFGDRQGDYSGSDATGSLVAELGEYWTVENGKAVPLIDFHNLNTAVIDNVSNTYYATGYVIHPVPAVTTMDGKALTEDSDYTVSYSAEDDSAPGNYSLTITGIEGSGFYGSRSVGYEVLEVQDKDIDGLGTGAIGNPAVLDAGSTAPWTGSYVYYGNYNRKGPVRYRVLDKEATEFNEDRTLLLDCDSLLYIANNNLAQTGLINDSFLTKEGCFTDIERSAIVSSTKPARAEGDGEGEELYSWKSLEGIKVFLLDVVEATRGSYGYGRDAGRTKSGENSSEWWLRSEQSGYKYKAGSIKSDGSIFNRDKDIEIGVSPAFNVGLSSVLFSSSISGSNNGDDEHKLTILDDKMVIAVPSGSKVTRDGSEVIVPYVLSGDDKGNVNRISVLLLKDEYQEGVAVTNGSGTGTDIPEYTYLPLETALKNDGTTGGGIFELPDDYANKVCGTDYHAYIVAEDDNGTYETDYASAPEEISVEHSHSLNYEAEGSTITATCSEAGCPFPEGKASITINRPSDLEYDGNLKAAFISGDVGLLGTSAISYQEKTGSDTWSEPVTREPRNAGTYKASFTLGSGSGAVTASIEYTVTARTVTITGLGAANKECDGTAAAEVTGQAVISGKLANDDVSVLEGSASFSDAEPGTGKTVTFTGYSLTGRSVGNYSLSGQPTSVTADITKRSITIKAADQFVKTGGTIATGTDQVAVTAGSFLTGHRLSDITLTGSGTEDVTESGTITPGNAVILDSSDNNVNEYYDITYAAGNLTVKNEPVYICGLTASDKTYDGTLSVNIAGNPVLKTVSDDTVVVGLSVYDIKAEFDDKNAGSEKAVTIKSATLSNSADYTLVIGMSNEKLSLSANITPREAVLSWNCLSFEYDGTEKCPSVQVDNLITGDTCEVTVSGGQTDANEEGTTYTAEVVGLSNSNYKLPEKETDRNAEYTIEKADIDVSAITEPVAVSGLAYNGKSQSLTTTGKVKYGIGTIYYALTDGNASQAPPFDGKEASAHRKWGMDVPKAKDVGTYKVWWTVIGDRNHKDQGQTPVINVKINKGKYPGEYNDKNNPLIVYVPYNFNMENATVELPAVPDGASYVSWRVDSGNISKILLSIKGNVLTYSVWECEEDQYALYCCFVNETTNYDGYCIYVKFIARYESVLTVNGIEDTYEYTGEEIGLDYEVYLDDTKITDYSAVLARNGVTTGVVKEKGEYTLTVTAEGCDIPKTVTFTVGKKPMTIGSEDDWNDFADWVNEGYDYKGMTVELTSDISVKRVVGCEYDGKGEASILPFRGTFNGGGHTLTIAFDEAQQWPAPFASIDGAVVENLVVKGSLGCSGIWSSGAAGGIAALCYGSCTVAHCISGITIDNEKSFDGDDAQFYSGGFVGTVDEKGTLSFEDCLFSGSIKSKYPNYASGFVGLNFGTVSVKNCLYDPENVIFVEFPGNEYESNEYSSDYNPNCVFVPEFNWTYQGAHLNLINARYRWLPDGVKVQGKDGSSLTAEKLAEELGRGWEVKNQSPVPIVDWNEYNLATAKIDMAAGYVSDGSSYVCPWPLVFDLNGYALERDSEYVVTYNDLDDSSSGFHTLIISGSERSDYYGSKTASYHVYSAKDKTVSCLGCSPDITLEDDVDPSSVIFTSRIPGFDGEYNLTLSDNRLDINVPEDSVSSRSGSTVTVPYYISGDRRGYVNRVSVLLLREEYQSGKYVVNSEGAGIPEYTYLALDTDIKKFGEAGSGTFELPEVYDGLKCGTDYHVYILAEQFTLPESNDFASAPLEIQIQEENPVVGPIPVKLKQGSSVTLKSSILTYGEPLSALSFNSAVFVTDDGNETVVSGTLGWKDPNLVPEPDISDMTWVFTPTDPAYAVLEGTCSVEVKEAVIHVNSVSFRSSEYNVKKGGTITLSPVISPENATIKTVTWRSEDNYIARVNGNGLVTAVGEGTVKIWVKTDDEGKEAFCKVTVTEEKPGPGPVPPKPEPETEYHLLTGETRRLNLNTDGEYVYGVRWELYDVEPKGCVTLKNGIVTAKNLKKGYDHGTAKVKAVVYGAEDMVFEITVDDRIEGENGTRALPVAETISEGKKTYKLTAPKTIKTVVGAAKNKTAGISIPVNMRDPKIVISVNVLNTEVCDVARDQETGAPKAKYNKDDRNKASKATYEIVAKDAGATWICWSMTDESKTENNVVTVWTKVIVTKPMDETLSINGYSEKTPMELSVGEGEWLSVFTTMDNTDPKDLTFSVKGKGVKVSKSGYVSATAPGSEAEVTVKSGKIKKTIKVKLKDDHKDRYLTLNKVTAQVKAPQDNSKKPAKIQLKLATPKKKAEQPAVTWSVEEDPSEGSLKGIIDVDENGLVTVSYKAKPGCYRIKAEAKAENASVSAVGGDTSTTSDAWNEAYCEVIISKTK